MNTQAIIFVIAIVMILVIAIGWGRRGPRVTIIETKPTDGGEDDA